MVQVKQAKISLSFSKELEDIKSKRLRNGKDSDRISTQKLTAKMIKHLEWPVIKEDLINEEAENF